MTPTTALVFLSVLFPAKGWFSPDQAWNVTVRPPEKTSVRLVLTDFSGSTIDAVPGNERDFDKEGTADLKHCFPAITTGGCYLLYAVPRPAGPEGEARENVSTFVGTFLPASVGSDDNLMVYASRLIDHAVAAIVDRRIKHIGVFLVLSFAKQLDRVGTNKRFFILRKPQNRRFCRSIKLERRTRLSGFRVRRIDVRDDRQGRTTNPPKRIFLG